MVKKKYSRSRESDQLQLRQDNGQTIFEAGNEYSLSELQEHSPRNKEKSTAEP